MITQRRKFNTIAWGWAAGWALALSGQALSDVFSNPNRGLTAYYVLGFVGWAIGAAGTIQFIRQRFGADGNVTALSAAGWGLGALTALVFGLTWMQTWNLGFLGSPVAAALGGTIGGALTLPLRSLPAPARIVRACLWGALSWGGAFLVFQILAFYAGYILVVLTAARLAPFIGYAWAIVPGWAIPAGLGGLAAGWLASKALLGSARLAEG